MSNLKTRKDTTSKLSEYIGKGNEFLQSELPTNRAIIRKAILIKVNIKKKKNCTVLLNDNINILKDYKFVQ